MGHAAQRRACGHCGLAVPAGVAGEFCCDGCRAVHALLRDEGLLRYYDLRGDRGVPVSARGSADHKWLELVEADTPRDPQGTRRVRLSIQGIHCAACVWLIEEIARRAHALRAEVNPARGTIALAYGPSFALAPFVADVEQLGYVLGPPERDGARDGARPEARASSGLLLRMGISIALALNAMSFAVAIYAGLDDGAFAEIARTAGWALTAASVLVGGTVFIRSAFHALRRRVLHLDLPIALGIVLAFAGSTWAYFAASGAQYFDTVAVFIALMLVGRFLQERVVERNRRQVLASDGVDSLLSRRLDAAGRPALVSCTSVVAGDRLLIAPGDLVPVAAELEGDAATISLDWIEGESVPREIGPAARIPAGAFNAGAEAIVVCARAPFAASELVELLRTPRVRDPEGARSTAIWQRFTGAYVASVLLAATAGFALWMVRTGDVVHALEVTTAILVVTCPCALGIATPLAYELVQAGLRRAGLFVRTAGFLDRAVEVRRVVFDKTGTLTTGKPRLASRAPLAILDATSRAVLTAMVARSTHPKSAAIAAELPATGPGLAVVLDRVLEVSGQGLEASYAGHGYRVGSPEWAAPGAYVIRGTDLVFARDGRVLAALRTEEALRPDARDEVAALRREGLAVNVLSGDRPGVVRAMAEVLALPAADALGAHGPRDKAAWLASNDRRDTLFVGDGINDSLAVERAWCSGTPAVDRPFMPARSDFYFVTPGLGPIRLALRAAHALRRVTRRNVAFAIAYNVAVVAVAMAGGMSPLLAAVLMPLGSIAVVAVTTFSLDRRSVLWRS